MDTRRTSALSFAVIFAAAHLVGCATPTMDPRDGGASDVGPAARACSTTLSFKPARPATTVTVGGEWNRFTPAQSPMLGPDGQGNYTITLDLAPGSYGYKFVLDATEWLFDPSTPYTKYVGSEENSVVEVEDCHAPKIAFVSLDRSATSGTTSGVVRYIDGADGAGFDPAAITVTLDGATVSDVQVDPDGTIRFASANLSQTKHRYTITATDRAGHAAQPLLIPFWLEAQPFDFRDGLLYFVFTDRFRNGAPENDSPSPAVAEIANYDGGDYAGVRAALAEGYFEALGVRTLWLSPPNTNPSAGFPGSDGRSYSGYHGYWPSEGREVQPRFGTIDELKDLVKEAHARGIRVILDSVLNHVHSEHPLYQTHRSEGWFNGDGSCVCGGVNCDWDSHAIDCWFTSYLPDINYTNFDALKAMIDDALYWVREVDVDGFRVDAVKHFPHIASKRLRAKLHDDFEHAGVLFYLVGETFTGGDDVGRHQINSFVGPDELHAQFDFPLFWGILGAIAQGGSMRSLEAAAAAGDAIYGSAPMSPFFGNHDVPRFLSEAAGGLWMDPKEQGWQVPPPAPMDSLPYQKLRLALTFVATQPGVPLLYYGDEVALPGAGDPDNRRAMKWSGLTSDEQFTYAHSKRLGQARKELAALRRGNRLTLWVDEDFYVYARVSASEVALVVINRAGTARTETVPIPLTVPLPHGTQLTDRLNGSTATVTNGAIVIHVDAMSSQVLAP